MTITALMIEKCLVKSKKQFFFCLFFTFACDFFSTHTETFLNLLHRKRSTTTTTTWTSTLPTTTNNWKCNFISFPFYKYFIFIVSEFFYFFFFSIQSVWLISAVESCLFHRYSGSKENVLLCCMTALTINIDIHIDVYCVCVCLWNDFI